MCAQPTNMQCLNTKIKEEEIGNDAYVGESSALALSHQSTVAQQKVLLSPRIEIHRIVKNHHSNAVTAAHSIPNDNNGEPTFDNCEATFDNGDATFENGETTYDNGEQDRNRIKIVQQLQPSSLPAHHQFVSPPNNCAVLHYREHRTETTSMALPQQRVHVIKDGRFYSTTTTTVASSSPSPSTKGIVASGTTTSSAAASATGPTATSKNKSYSYL